MTPPSTTLYYIAYGSNLHPLRLQQRLPGARILARIVLPAWQLRFHKRGQDGSGKCDLWPGQGAAYGALYQIGVDEGLQLDRIEDGYARQPMTVALAGQRISAFTYRASDPFIAPALRPFDWYVELLLAGAEALAFEPTYRTRLATMACMDDGDGERNRAHRALAAELGAAAGGALRELPWGTAYATSTIS